MHAIIETGGKQYRVKEGDTVYIEKLDLDANSSSEFNRVLAVFDDNSTKIGSPFVEGVKVKFTVVAHVKGKKIIVFKYKAKKDYRRKNGHRQPYTKIIIDKIEC
ncbi:50S ribosomal protein L21 [Candidatus Arthromitus sp. SFB-rat-Yit]|uniref:50S ribosomal protein L21 n=1 Tax=Candidatus Arthromitus sp. SFB-rat-Yit TaxID=1041504 RepID=UPI000227A3E1|nr:50S ribosomal protein L21 [Candidatus Arthromitus sp. SFB-rat-Yit]BAK80898.1 50S ribosomal protein L21 [Candidatus Arthromitus sp. SFB-rat-Yit]